jgi:hypothetical protein
MNVNSSLLFTKLFMYNDFVYATRLVELRTTFRGLHALIHIYNRVSCQAEFLRQARELRVPPVSGPMVQQVFRRCFVNMLAAREPLRQALHSLEDFSITRSKQARPGRELKKKKKTQAAFQSFSCF